MAGALDRSCQAALVARAGAGAPPRQNLSAIRDIALQPLDILVVGHADLIGAEATHLAPRNKLAPTSGATGAAWPTTITTSKI